MRQDKAERICIIGGGPAGLTMAMYLEKAGYENYEILEKNAWVGGKCNSPEYKGKRYEMGAIMGVPSYYAVHDAEEFCGITHDGPTLNRNYKMLDGKVYDPFDPKKISNLPRLLKMKNQTTKLARLLETKYKGYDVNGHRGVSEGRYEGYDANGTGEWVSGTNENLKDLALPFKVFCAKNGVDLVQDIWIGPFTAFGYGYFDEIPAAYVLKYLDFQTTMNFVKCNLWTWKNGTQSIWEQLDAHLKHPAKLSQDIEKVERRDGKIYVTANGETAEYDKLIITAPLQFFPDYADATDQEKELFSKIEYERYDVLACLIKKGQYPPISYYMFDNMDLKRIGHLMVYYCRWRGEEDQVITTYTLRKHKDREEIPYETAKQMVLDDMKICGSEVEEVINEQSWYYFPHIFSEDYRKGWYQKVESMQGINNTYYAGEVMSFGDMDETSQYSKELVHRFFDSDNYRPIF
jgi:protoporphyrinogen oxidase